AIAECKAADALTLDQLAGMLDHFRVRPRFKPTMLVKKSITANEWYYDGVPWPTDEQLAATVRKREIQDLSWAGDDVVAAWTVRKFQSLLRLAETLTEDKRPSTVIRFLANSRRVPRPRTWGEVALIKGRLVAGQW